MKKGIRLNPKDNVGVVIQDAAAGEEVDFDNGLIVTALDTISLPHKLALKNIKAGDYVIKYGEIMGMPQWTSPWDATSTITTATPNG